MTFETPSVGSPVQMATGKRTAPKRGDHDLVNACFHAYTTHRHNDRGDKITCCNDGEDKDADNTNERRI